MRHPLDDVLTALLPNADVFAVGGRVRDEFRSLVDGIDRPPKDLDYVVTGIPLDDLLSALRAAGRVDVVGAAFAVLKFRSDLGEADIALPRREHSTGVGHTEFAVEAGPEIPLEDDLRRRDFRMNMIARRLRDQEVVDPFGGVADIRAERIDVVADEAFAEDPLRMLRAAQFAARFRYDPTERVRQAMRLAAPLLASVSPERVGIELAKLMSAQSPSIGIEILRETGVLAHLWPELLEGLGVDQNEWHAYDVYRHNLATLDAAPPADFPLRLAALLHDVGKPRTAAPREDGRGNTFYQHEHVGAEMVPAMLERLRLPRETVETVTHLVRHHMYAADPEAQDKTLRRFVRRIGVERLDRLFALRWADIAGSGLPKRDESNERFEARVAAVLAERPAFSVRDLAISGDEVIGLFVQRGVAEPGFRGDRRVGEVLQALLEEVTDDPSRNEAAVLAKRAERYIDEHFSAPSVGSYVSAVAQAHKTARVIALVNQKGGVGKTTTAVNLGASLALLGRRVLVVDTDPQGNTTTGMGVDKRTVDRDVYNVLLQNVAIADVVLSTDVENLWIVPATLNLAGAEIELVAALQRELRLKTALRPVLERYDDILIDCPPSLGLLTINALTAANELIIPVQAEYYALEGLTQLVTIVRRIKEGLNPDLTIRGVLITMFDGRTKLAGEVLEEVHRYFPDRVFQTQIPRNIRLSEAPSYGKPAILFDVKSRGAQAYLSLAKELTV